MTKNNHKKEESQGERERERERGDWTKVKTWKTARTNRIFTLKTMAVV